MKRYKNMNKKELMEVISRKEKQKKRARGGTWYRQLSNEQSDARYYLDILNKNKRAKR